MSTDQTFGNRTDSLTRRQILGAAALSAAAAIAPRAISQSVGGAIQSGIGSGHDVVIIGGGFCGVTAARECHNAGYRVLLLEARNRLGGRTFTSDFNGHRIDLGGTWVHWTQPHVWSEIHRYGLAITETRGASADTLIVRTRTNDIVTLSMAKHGGALAKAVDSYMGDARALLPRPHEPFFRDGYKAVDHISSAERLDSLKGLSPLYRDVLDGYFSACAGNTHDKVAWLDIVRWYALAGYTFSDMNDAIGRYHLVDGTVSLLSQLIAESKVDVRLGAPVRAVHVDGMGVTVVTAAGEEVHAPVVISTVPLNVLKDIEWVPALSEARASASKETHAGFSTKIHAVIEGARADFMGITPGGRPLNWVYDEIADGGHSHVIGFGPGPEFLDVSDTAQVQNALRQFLPDVHVIQSIGYDFTSDPYSKGTWCMFRPEQWSRYWHELQRPARRVIFASADWAHGWRGFIDGAIEQGVEAARQAKVLLSS